MTWLLLTAGREAKVKDEAERHRWSKHDQLQRGGEIRTYRGPDFTRA